MNVERVTIKYNGEFHEFPVDQLDINPQNPTDAAVFAAVRGTLGAETLTGFVVDPPEGERQAGQHDAKTVLNIRPTATYGQDEVVMPRANAATSYGITLLESLRR